MRIALVTPYSWSYPGGVNRHVEALSLQLMGRGHEVRAFAPWDPDDRFARLVHRGPTRRGDAPDWLVPLGRTVGIGANGAVSNLSVFPSGPTSLRRELGAFAPDVVHVHEPPAPLVSWDACSWRGAPVVGTFHAYSAKPVPNQIATLLGARRKLNQLSARIAVSRAAEWTGMRWFGGSYTVIPNGVDLSASAGDPDPARPAGERSSGELEVLFVGRAEERKGLPVLLSAFEALVEHVPARLTVVGSSRAEVERYLGDDDARRRIAALGPVRGSELWRRLAEADVLCAPSLSGESFGMIITEAFASGTPVIASNIAGYADVVTDGVDGILVPPADPQRLAEQLQRLHHEPELRAGMAGAARESARRYAWPVVAEQVEDVYRRAASIPAAATRPQAWARRIGLVPSDGTARSPARRLEPPDPDFATAAGRRTKVGRRVGLGAAGALGVGLSVLAGQRIGLENVANSIVRSDFTWLLLATALMMGALLARATAWLWICRSALPRAPLRRRDVTSAAMIGVLMSATLPARLGEPARAMVLARRTGRMRESLPVLLGTLVSQTALNIVALAALGAMIVLSTDLFHSATKTIFLFSLAPLVLLLAVVVAPTVLQGEGNGRASRGLAALRRALLRIRSGLGIFRDARRGPLASLAQLSGWGLQLLACWALFAALGLDRDAGIVAAAAVLFAVNVTAAIPATPSNVGLFQIATISVLTTGFGVSAANALAYGVVLQAVEIATAVGMGLPALVREGMSWSDMRLRALSAAPVRLSPQHSERGAGDPVTG